MVSIYKEYFLLLYERGESNRGSDYPCRIRNLLNECSCPDQDSTDMPSCFVSLLGGGEGSLRKIKKYICSSSIHYVHEIAQRLA